MIHTLAKLFLNTPQVIKNRERSIKKRKKPAIHSPFNCDPSIDTFKRSGFKKTGHSSA